MWKFLQETWTLALAPLPPYFTSTYSCGMTITPMHVVVISNIINVWKNCALTIFHKNFYFIWTWFLINVGSYIEWFSTLDHKRIGEFSFLYFYYFIFWKKKEVMIGMGKRKENFQLVKTFCLISIFQVLENLDSINSFKLVKYFFLVSIFQVLENLDSKYSTS